jgi:site-specific DNA-cytosine methylase
MDRLGALGNSIVVPVAEWLGRRLLEAIGDGVT